MGAIEELKQNTGLVKKPQTIVQMMEDMRPEMAKVLPKHLHPERMLRIAVTQLRTTPKLAECTAHSILSCVMMAAQLGLEPGIGGQAYLVPYFDRKKGVLICTLIPGWQGILDLVGRAGKASAWTGAVYQGDEFDWGLGDRPFLKHKPCGEEEELTHVYAIGRPRSSQFPVIEVWTKAKVIKHRDRYNKVGDKHYSFTNFEMYARKVALLQVLKYLPKSIEVSRAQEVDAQAEMGAQRPTFESVKGFLDGELVAEPENTQGEILEGDPVASSDPQGLPLDFDGSVVSK